MALRGAAQPISLVKQQEVSCILGLIRELQRLHERRLAAIVLSNDEVHPAEAIRHASTDATVSINVD
jgi:hypothetical protein